jgi:hypothetical protein
VKNFKVITRYNNKEIASTNNGVVSHSFPKLKKKYLKLRVESPDREPEEFRFKRVVRRDAWWRSFGLGLFTYFTPFLIDYTNANFYKVHPKKNQMDLVLIYTEDYAHRLYVGLVERNDLEGIRRFVSDFKGYRDWSAAVDFRDKLELDLAINQKKEASIDQFISSHPNSKYLDEAKRIKQDFAVARENFSKACQLNSVLAYESFLSQFPNSIHNIDANLRLLDAAEKVALGSNSIDAMEKYILNYLVPKAQYINSSSTTSVEIKKQSITKAINSQIQKEFLGVGGSEYDKYSRFWKRYIDLKSTVSSNYLGEIESVIQSKNKICSVIYDRISSYKTMEQQKDLNSRLNSDFPKFSDSPNLVFYVLDNLIGLRDIEIVLFNQRYLPYYCTKPKYVTVCRMLDGLTYDGVAYNPFSNADGELISIKSQKVSSYKAFNGSDLIIDFKENAVDGGWRVDLYNKNELIKTIYKSENTNYAFDFKGGINLSLKQLDESIMEGDRHKNTGDYNLAMTTYKSALNNTFPSSFKQNIELKKRIENLRTIGFWKSDSYVGDWELIDNRRKCNFCEEKYCDFKKYSSSEIDSLKQKALTNKIGMYNNMSYYCSANCKEASALKEKQEYEERERERRSRRYLCKVCPNTFGYGQGFSRGRIRSDGSCYNTSRGWGDYCSKDCACSDAW